MQRHLVSALMLGLIATSACDCNKAKTKGHLMDLAEQPDGSDGTRALDLGSTNKPACNGSIVITAEELMLSVDEGPCDVVDTVDGVDWETGSQSPGELCPAVKCRGYVVGTTPHFYNGKLSFHFDDLPCRVERVDVEVLDNASKAAVGLYSGSARVDYVEAEGSNLQTLSAMRPGADATRAEVQLCSGDFFQITLY